MPPLRESSPSGAGMNIGRMTLDEMERSAMLAALRKADGNKTEAAKLLGITRRMVYSRMKKLGIKEEDI